MRVIIGNNNIAIVMFSTMHAALMQAYFSWSVLLSYQILLFKGASWKQDCLALCSHRGALWPPPLWLLADLTA